MTMSENGRIDGPGATEQVARRGWVSVSPVGQGRRHPSYDHDSVAGIATSARADGSNCSCTKGVDLRRVRNPAKITSSYSPVRRRLYPPPCGPETPRSQPRDCPAAGDSGPLRCAPSGDSIAGHWGHTVRRVSATRSNASLGRSLRSGCITASASAGPATASRSATSAQTCRSVEEDVW